MSEPNPKLYGIVLDLVTTAQTSMSLRDIDNSKIDNVIKQTLSVLFLKEDSRIVLENVREILIKLKAVLIYSNLTDNELTESKSKTTRSIFSEPVPQPCQDPAEFIHFPSTSLQNYRLIAQAGQDCESTIDTMIDTMIEKRTLVKSVILELFKYLQSVSVTNAQDALNDTGEEIDDLFLTTLILKDRKSPDKVAAQYEWHSADELTVMYTIPGDLFNNNFLHPSSTYVVRKRGYGYSQKKTIYTFVGDVDTINVIVRKNLKDKLQGILLEYNTKI